MRKLLRKYAFVLERLVTGDLRSYSAAVRDLGIERAVEEQSGYRPDRRLRAYGGGRRRDRLRPAHLRLRALRSRRLSRAPDRLRRYAGLWRALAERLRARGNGNCGFRAHGPCGGGPGLRLSSLAARSSAASTPNRADNPRTPTPGRTTLSIATSTISTAPRARRSKVPGCAAQRVHDVSALGGHDDQRSAREQVIRRRRRRSAQRAI